jgi:hypothetical protein
VTELSDLRRYNTRLEHTLQNILVEVQQLRSRSEVEAAAAAANNGGGGGVRVKPEPDHQHQHHLQPTPAGVMTSASGGGGGQSAAAAAAAAANFHSFGNEVPGIATWRVHDSTLLECNDRFMEIVQQPLDTLKNNFKCLQLFPHVHTLVFFFFFFFFSMRVCARVALCVRFAKHDTRHDTRGVCE